MFDRLRGRSCPLPAPGQRPACVRPHHFLPLVAFLVPTAVIGYAIVLPRNGAGGLHELSVGFGATLVGVAVTYVVGILGVSRR